jgi:FixJ family two-component response regulator
MMSEPNPVIFVVDDDYAVREAVGNLLESVGYCSLCFGSADEFLRARRPDVPSCLLLDIRLPGVNGLDFQDALEKSGIRIPIIFITAHGDVRMTARAMKGGAVDVLAKPFQKDELLTAIHHALSQDSAARTQEAEVSKLRARYETLTKREREVVDLVVTGLMNRQIATQLGITEITVKIHRGRAMEKMRANSLLELVRMSERLKGRPQS